MAGVLAPGGLDINFASVANCEVYDVGLGLTSAWRPKVKAIKSGETGFNSPVSISRGLSQASSGNTQDSSSTYPVVQLCSIDGGRVTFLPVDP
jgi:hypothetical protein